MKAREQAPGSGRDVREGGRSVRAPVKAALLSLAVTALLASVLGQYAEEMAFTLSELLVGEPGASGVEWPDWRFSLSGRVFDAAFPAMYCPIALIAFALLMMLRGRAGRETRCRHCHTVLRDLREAKCPVCGEKL